MYTRELNIYNRRGLTIEKSHSDEMGEGKPSPNFDCGAAEVGTSCP